MDVISLDRNLQTQVDSLSSKLVVVNSQADRDRISADVKDAKLMKNTVINFLKGIKESAHRTWKGICEMETTNTSKCDAFIRAADRAILTYDEAQEAKRQAAIFEQEEIARKAKADAAAALAEDAEDESTAADREQVAAEAGSLADIVFQAQNTAAQLEAAPAVRKQAGESVRAIWHARITDPTLVPREYLIVDIKTLEMIAKTEAVKTGERKIAGVEFYTEQIIARRNTY